MTTHPNRSFRRGAFAATAIASLAVSSLFPGQASAQTAPMPAAYQGTAACAKFAKADRTLEKAVQCEARELDRRIAAEKQKGMEADRRGADADRRRAGFVREGLEADRRGAAADARSAAASARGREAEVRGAAADKRAAQSERVIQTADAAKACYDGIKQEVVAAKRIAPLTVEQKTTFRARAAECERT